MKIQHPTPFIFFLFAVALAACEGGDPGSAASLVGAQITPPTACGNGDPTCNVAIDFPEQADLSGSNQQNLIYSATDGGLTLQAGSGSIVDTDGDGVPDPADECAGPGGRLPCERVACDDGIWLTV